MTTCDLCGIDTTNLVEIKLEEAKLKSCNKCSSYGQVTSNHKLKTQNYKPRGEKIETLVDNYNLLIKNAREKLNLSQMQLAEKIKEKDTIISKIETGMLKPDLGVAKKLERVLAIILIQYTETYASVENTRTAELTIGDIIKLKK